MPNFVKVEVTESNVIYWKPTRQGEAIEGIYTERKTGIPTSFGEIDAMLITTDKGEVYQVLITAGLVRAVDMLDTGELIRIEYHGKQYNKATKRQYTHYEVYRDCPS